MFLKKSVSSLITVLLLIVVGVLIITLFLNFSKDFANDSLSKTNNFVTNSGIQGDLIEDYSISVVLYKNNNLILENLSKNDLNIVGYKITSDFEGYFFNNLISIVPKLISSGKKETIRIQNPPESNFNIQLFTSNGNYLSFDIENHLGNTFAHVFISEIGDAAYPKNIISTLDGGYILISSNDGDPYLTKFNNFDKEWILDLTSFGCENEVFDYSKLITQNKDGSIGTVCYVDSSFKLFKILETESDPIVDWDITLPSYMTTYDFLYPTEDNGFVVIGIYDGDFIRFSKYSSDGSLIWDDWKTSAYTGTGALELNTSIKTKSGDYLVLFTDEYDSLYFILISSDGVVINSDEYNGPINTSYGADVLEYDTNYFTVAYYTEDNSIEIDSNINFYSEDYSYFIIESEFDEFTCDNHIKLFSTNDNGFAILTTEDDFYPTFPVLIKFDSALNFDWNYYLLQEDTEHDLADYFFSMEYNKYDDSFLYLDFNYSGGSESTYDIILTKIDGSTGELIFRKNFGGGYSGIFPNTVILQQFKDNIKQIIPTVDGGFVISLSTGGYIPIGFVSSVPCNFIFKIDKYGNCKQIDDLEINDDPHDIRDWF